MVHLKALENSFPVIYGSCQSLNPITRYRQAKMLMLDSLRQNVGLWPVKALSLSKKLVEVFQKEKKAKQRFKVSQPYDGAAEISVLQVSCLKKKFKFL